MPDTDIELTALRAQLESANTEIARLQAKLQKAEQVRQYLRESVDLFRAIAYVDPEGNAHMMSDAPYEDGDEFHEQDAADDIMCLANKCEILLDLVEVT